MILRTGQLNGVSQKLLASILVLAIHCVCALRASGAENRSRAKTGQTLRFKIVEFADDEFGWAATDHSLWKTETGGRRWLPIRRSPNAVVRDGTSSRRSQLFIDRIQPLSRDDGWILEDATLLHTTDGGRHWDKFKRDKLDIRAFRFVDQQHGFFVAERLHYGDNIEFWREAEIYRSSDGGRNWRKVQLKKRLEWIWLLDLWAASKDNIWVVGDVFLNSRDGGETWRPINFDHSGGLYGSGSHVEFVDASRGWIEGANGGFAVTTNGGRTWVQTSSDRQVRNLIKEKRGHPWRKDG